MIYRSRQNIPKHLNLVVNTEDFSNYVIAHDISIHIYDGYDFRMLLANKCITEDDEGELYAIFALFVVLYLLFSLIVHWPRVRQ